LPTKAFTFNFPINENYEWAGSATITVSVSPKCPLVRYIGTGTGTAPMNL